MIHYNEETRNSHKIDSLIGQRIEKLVDRRTAIEWELLMSNIGISKDEIFSINVFINRFLDKIPVEGEWIEPLF